MVTIWLSDGIRSPGSSVRQAKTSSVLERIFPGRAHNHVGVAMTISGLKAASEYAGTEDTLERCVCGCE